MQSGGIRRKIYIRLLNQLPGMRGLLWILTKLPFGITYAWRQWLCVVEDWMLK